MNTRFRATAMAAWLCAATATATASAQSEKAFFGNLHSHTSYSDGVGKPREAYTHARDVAKIDFLAITEHNHAEASGDDHISIATTPPLYNGTGPEALIKVAGEFTQAGKFVAIYGQEFSTIGSGNHMNVFDIGEVITTPKGRFDKLLEFAAAKKDSFGNFPVLMFNHPKNTLDVNRKEYGEDDFGSFVEFVKRMGAHASLIQMINGPGTGRPGPHEAARPDEAAYLKFLNLGFKLAPTADQDNHFNDWGDATSARTGVVATELTKAKILEALRARHVFATQDKNLSVIVRVNSRLCGDIITPLPATGALSISYEIRDADEPDAEYELQVFRDAVGGGVAAMVHSVTLPIGGGAGQVSGVAFSGEPQYFFFRIKQFDEDGGEDLAWTAPVWFEQTPGAPLALNEDAVFPRMMRVGEDARLRAAAVAAGLANQVPDLDALATMARANFEAAPKADPAGFLASRDSNVFHVSGDCLDSKAISDAERVTGVPAHVGREPHLGCPRLR